MKIFDISTEKIRFDFLTMIEEWRDFLEGQCGYDKADPALVSALASEQSRVFRMVLDENGIFWIDLDGQFAISDDLSWCHEGFPFSTQDMDQIWSDTFETINEAFDHIEETLAEEREAGLV